MSMAWFSRLSRLKWRTRVELADLRQARRLAIGGAGDRWLAGGRGAGELRRCREADRAATGARPLEEGRLDDPQRLPAVRGVERAPRPEASVAVRLDGAHARSRPSTRRAMSSSVVSSVAARSSVSGSSGYSVVEDEAGDDPLLDERGVAPGGVGEVERDLVEVRGAEPTLCRGRPPRGRRRGGAPGSRTLGHLAEALRAPRRRGRRWRPGRTGPGWCRCCWPPSRDGCAARGPGG